VTCDSPTAPQWNPRLRISSTYSSLWFFDGSAIKSWDAGIFLSYFYFYFFSIYSSLWFSDGEEGSYQGVGRRFFIFMLFSGTRDAVAAWDAGTIDNSHDDYLFVFFKKKN